MGGVDMKKTTLTVKAKQVHKRAKILFLQTKKLQTILTNSRLIEKLSKRHKNAIKVNSLKKESILIF